MTRVLFRVAAGPRRGFGHLVRCGVLARALGVRPRVVSLRGTSRTVTTARRQGWRVLTGASAAASRAIATVRPHLLVIDDPSPSHVAAWVRAAHAAGVPVATIHDLGLGRRRGRVRAREAVADLTIDGSLPHPGGASVADLQGPAFAILHPDLAGWRVRRPVRQANRVLITLGGGIHTRVLGPRLAARIRRAVPGVRVDLALGLLPAGIAAGPLPAGCRWISTPHGLAPALATASAAVVAGGITLYEACVLGTPVVTLAVTPAQRATTAAFAAAGATIDARGARTADVLDRAAAGIARILADPREAESLARHGRRLVDAAGTARVARHLVTLAGREAGEHRHAA